MKHEHNWVQVWTNGIRSVYRCDIRNLKGNWNFCGEFGYALRRGEMFPDLDQQRRIKEMIRRLRRRETHDW